MNVDDPPPSRCYLRAASAAGAETSLPIAIAPGAGTDRQLPQELRSTPGVETRLPRRLLGGSRRARRLLAGYLGRLLGGRFRGDRDGVDVFRSELVKRARRADNHQRRAIDVHAPDVFMESARVEVPELPARGQGHPRPPVVRLGHLDEKDVRVGRACRQLGQHARAGLVVDRHGRLHEPLQQRIVRLGLHVEQALQLGAGPRADGAVVEVDLLEVRVHVDAACPKVERARHVRDDALPTLALVRHAHPHIPVEQRVRSRPLWLQLLEDGPREQPAEAGHGLDAVQPLRRVRGVLVAQIVPGGHAVERGVQLHQRQQLREEEKVVGRRVNILFVDDCVFC
eukprot:m.37712 g.37712  ORF g.37712 m.37712 type:complete len:340 (+) comp5460_c0_seq2:164-1183(+)